MASELPQQELLSAYLDGELGQEQRAQVEALLANDDRYAELLGQWQQQRDQLARLPKYQASTEFADRLMGRLDSLADQPDPAAELVESASANVKSGSVNWRLVGAAVASLAALLLIVLSVLPGQFETNQSVARHDAAGPVASEPAPAAEESQPVLDELSDAAGGDLAMEAGDMELDASVAMETPSDFMDDMDTESFSIQSGLENKPSSELVRRNSNEIAARNRAAKPREGLSKADAFSPPAPASLSALPPKKMAKQLPADAAISSSRSVGSVPQVVLYQRAEMAEAIAVEQLKSTLARNNIKLQSVEEKNELLVGDGFQTKKSSGGATRAIRLTVNSTPGAMRSALTELSVSNDIALIPAAGFGGGGKDGDGKEKVLGYSAGSFSDGPSSEPQESARDRQSGTQDLDELLGMAEEGEAERPPVDLSAVGRSSEIRSNLAGEEIQPGQQSFELVPGSADRRELSEPSRQLSEIQSDEESLARAQLGYRSRNRVEADQVVEQLYQQQVGALPNREATTNYVLILELPESADGMKGKTKASSTASP